jgi:hypothetical protein
VVRGSEEKAESRKQKDRRRSGFFMGRDLCPKGPLVIEESTSSRVHLARLAPAAMVSALQGRIALPGEDGRKETADSFAFA